VVTELTRLEPLIVGRPVEADRDELIATLHARGVALSDRREGHSLAVLASGLDVAWADLCARVHQQPLWQELGGRPLQTVDLYANINRGLWTRTPDEFAERARQAVAEGFTRIKCAPFDHLPLAGAALREAGLLRLEAVRDAVGPDVELYVDAHAKLPIGEVFAALEVFERLHVAWLEDAVRLDRPDLLRAVRARTGLHLVGGEQTYRATDLVPALDAHAFDAVLLDVKYTGGLDALRGLIAIVSDRGLPVSLHNSAGPVATAASVAATTTIPVPTVLEYAFGEAPWRAQVIDPTEVVMGGTVRVPTSPGLGVDVNDDYAPFVAVDRFLTTLSETAPPGISSP
ncbi:MAG TPA: enolase C-terminal domain-like protein, partial [Acidimicrobiales bacterium]